MMASDRHTAIAEQSNTDLHYDRHSSHITLAGEDAFRYHSDSILL